MSKMIDKQALLEKIKYYETQYSASASHFDHGIIFLCRNLISSVESGRFDAEEDQRYEAIVQALRDGYRDGETAAGLIAWVESTCPFVGDLREQDSQ